MASLQACRFAELGFGTLLIDPFGTADSQGEFADARWDIWRDDFQRAVQWLFEHGAERLIFWGLRLGALLAVELAATLGQAEHLILWQPVMRGEVFMTQFLRLRLAADMAGRDARLTTQDLRARLSTGSSLEIAGYTLAPRMVSAVDSLDLLRISPAKLPMINWIEITADSERPISAASLRILDRWQAAGVRATSHKAVGEPFWHTPEITVVPTLLSLTARLLDTGS